MILNLAKLKNLASIRRVESDFNIKILRKQIGPALSQTIKLHTCHFR